MGDFTPVGRIFALFGTLYGFALTTFFDTVEGLSTSLAEFGFLFPWASLLLAGVVLGKRLRTLAALALVITASEIAYLVTHDNGCCAGGHVLAFLTAPLALLALASLLCFLASREPQRPWSSR